jgi:hypothetical protein
LLLLLLLLLDDRRCHWSFEVDRRLLHWRRLLVDATLLYTCIITQYEIYKLHQAVSDVYCSSLYLMQPNK